jgi:hypothetical protein
MFGERRSQPRFRIDRVARIHAEKVGMSCECMITDISGGGARLFVVDVELPEQFVLYISGDKTMQEECKVVWRLGSEMGVRFVTRSLEQGRNEAINQLRALAQHRFKKQSGARRA